ncbi:MAG: two pore domain potassium channel family protein [Rhodospirillales bacterium]|nr:MAG: two pore domain potassium channel family protein [Rhodospirillales bacterium]
MILSILVGAAMIIATTLIHAGFMMAGLGDLRERVRKRRSSAASWRPAFVLSLFVLWMFLAAVVEVWLWSALYLLLGVFDALEIAVYFSTVTFTTLGYGDVVLTPPFRLLSSFQAVNGLILFGWTTALVFAVVQWLYKDDRAVGEHAMRPPGP